MRAAISARMWLKRFVRISVIRCLRRSSPAMCVWRKRPATASLLFIMTSLHAAQPAICSWHARSSRGRKYMARIGGLGKGMAALLQVTETVDESKNYFVCPIEKIRPNRNQPRKHFAPEKLEELAASIREKGIIQPLVVTRNDDHFELIAGERRWRAAQKAGLYEIP